MNDRIIELIEQKSFNELSEKEKQFIIKHISEKEYREKREIIDQIKNELHTESLEFKVKESTHLNALAALRIKKSHEKVKLDTHSRRGILTSKIPLWTAVAAVFLIFILTTPIFISHDFNQKENGPLLAKVDTVFIDKVIRDTVKIQLPSDTIVKTVYRVVSNENTLSEGVKEKSKSNENFELNDAKREQIYGEMEKVVVMGNYTNTIDFNESSKGKSLSDDPIGKVVLNITN